MKKSINAYLIIFIIYIMAIAVGAAVAFILKDDLHPILNLFIADVTATIVIYIFNLIFKNASIYDPYWSVIPPFLVVGYYLIYNLAFNILNLVVLLPFLFWSVRLTFNWAIGFSDIKWEDWRYREKRKQTGHLFPLVNFIGIMLMPTILTFLGTVPFYFILTATDTNFIPLAIGGLIVLLAAVFQMTADIQMKRFLKSRKKSDECMDKGVWALCRHPNYFAEISIWVGIFISSTINFSFLSIIGCVLIALLFIFISVPLMEIHMLKNRPSYAEYKKRVKTILLPFPPNRSASQ